MYVTTRRRRGHRGRPSAGITVLGPITACFAIMGVAAASDYDATVIPVRAPFGAQYGMSLGSFKITEAGTVVGSRAFAAIDLGDPQHVLNDQHAFLWDGEVHDLEPLDAPGRTGASAINAAGVVVGNWIAYVGDQQSTLMKATLWRDESTPVLLSVDGLGDSSWDPEHRYGEALDINAGGTVVGRCMQTDGSFWNVDWEHACRWTPDGDVVDLGALHEGDRSMARAVNASGMAAGSSGGRAVAWEEGGIVDLGIPSSLALDINDAGTVVGHRFFIETFGDNSIAAYHAFAWSAVSRSWSDINPPEAQSSSAVAINNHGEILLQAWYRDAASFTYTTRFLVYGGGLYEPAPEFLVQAFDLNDAGQILGLVWSDELADHSPVVLTPRTADDDDGGASGEDPVDDGWAGGGTAGGGSADDATTGTGATGGCGHGSGFGALTAAGLALQAVLRPGRRRRR
jgi:uncharacterized membrane protein